MPVSGYKLEVPKEAKIPIVGQTRGLEELGSDLSDLCQYKSMLEFLSRIVSYRINEQVDIASKHFLETQKIKPSELTYEQIEKWAIPNIPLAFHGKGIGEENLMGIGTRLTKEARIEHKMPKDLDADIQELGWTKPKFSVSSYLAKNFLKTFSDKQEQEVRDRLINDINNWWMDNGADN